MLIKIGIYFCFFIIGGLATTNIFRLLKGNTAKVLDRKCYCPACNAEISAVNQTPVFSFLWTGGRCKNCNSPIPVDGLIVEIVVFFGMSAIAFLGAFSPVSIFFSFVFYELVRIILVLIYGKREQEFFRQYIIAVVSMVLYFVLIEFLAVLLSVI